MLSFLARVVCLNLVLVAGVLGGRAAGLVGLQQTAPDSESGFYCGDRCWHGITIEKTTLTEARQIITSAFSKPGYQVSQYTNAGREIIVLQSGRAEMASPILGVSTQGGAVDAMQFYFSEHDGVGKVQQLGQLFQQFGPPTCVQPAYDSRTVFFLYENAVGNTQIMVQTRLHPLTLESPVWYLGMFRRRTTGANCSSYYYRSWAGLSESKYLPQP